MLQAGEIVEFKRMKHFKHVKPLGAGGTGDTYLFEDETTDMFFAFKKYSPKDSNFIEEYYDRFVDEIKILFKISHPSIVRVYNYYLYPELKSGYLQMEYIDGQTIDKFIPSFLGKEWADIFTEVISAFEYLELNNVLHRDIRPENILIDQNENVKVIDFGFGKKFESKDQDGKSVLLNWPVTHLPEETDKDGIYNHRTEIYFVGKLFQHLLGTELVNFKFAHIIDKMTKVVVNERYATFSHVSLDISNGVLGEIDFTEKEKRIYAKFAGALSGHISYYTNKYEPINDLNVTLTRIAALIRNSALETYVQDNSIFIRCFISGAYSYKTTNNIEVSCIIDFYTLLKRLTPFKQKIVLDNIYTRLGKIKITVNDEDLPF